MSANADSRRYGRCGTCGEDRRLTPGGKITTHTDPFHPGRECKGSRCEPEPA